MGPESPGFTNSFSLNLALQDGNSETLDLGAGMRLGYAKFLAPVDLASSAALEDRAEGKEDPEPEEAAEAEGHGIPRYVIFLVANYSLSEQDGERGTNRSFSHLRWVNYQSQKLAWEVFAQHQFNEFQRLDTRWLFGAGSRLVLLEEEHRELFFGLGYMFEFERLDIAQVASEDRESRHHRLTTYLSARIEKDERWSLVSTLYVQPRLDGWGDIRLLEETELEVRLGERVSLGLAVSLQHDSEPPAGVKDTDIALINKLRFSF